MREVNPASSTGTMPGDLRGLENRPDERPGLAPRAPSGEEADEDEPGLAEPQQYFTCTSVGGSRSSRSCARRRAAR